ncbi:general odorant-binding protein 83a-like [Lycorma delicatula]|uniref:general odorant-binding protein 83a-like n=1 Tax=Lycorma delicatula TaxID=130591 RepID=UPI003F51418B
MGTTTEMKQLYLISFVLFLSSLVHGFTDEELQLMNQLRTTCLEETGATGQAVDDTKKGIFPPDDDKLKCFFKCIWSTMSAMSDEGEIDEDVLQVLLPADLKDKLYGLIVKCKSAGGNSPCDKAYNIHKCIYNEDSSAYFTP